MSLGEVAGFLSLNFILQLNTELYPELSTELTWSYNLSSDVRVRNLATFPRKENAVLEQGICSFPRERGT